MGEIRLYKCECGYEEKLFAGAGRGGINLNNVERLFPKEAGLIRLGITGGSMESFLMDNVPAKCNLCNRICAASRLKYSVKDGEVHTSERGICSYCNNTDVEIISSWDGLKCPECGKEMDYIQTGHWD